MIFFPPCKYNTYMKCWGSVCLDLTTYSICVVGKNQLGKRVLLYILTGGRYFRLCCTMTVHSSHSCEVFNKTNRLRFEFYKEKVLKLLFGTVGRIWDVKWPGINLFWWTVCLATQWNVRYVRQVATAFRAGIYKQGKNLLNLEKYSGYQDIC